jgi:excisionase family DNA binding protein
VFAGKKEPANMLKTPHITATTGKAGWRVREWAADVGVSRAYVYKLLSRGALDSVKLGKSRIITTRPADYLASFRGTAA